MKFSIRSLLGFAALLLLGLFFLRPNPVRLGEGGRSPGGFDPFGQGEADGREAFQVSVSDPVLPEMAPAIATLPLWDGTVLLNREINPRANQTGNVFSGPGGIAGGVDPLLAVQADAPEASVLDFLTPIINIDGQGFTNVNPPDTVGDVGPDHYIQMINGGGTLISIYDKDGNLVSGPTSFTSLGGCATGVGDPIVLYDQMADRWLLSEFGAGNSVCVFISQGPDPINDPWFSYNFPTPSFPDYPKYAVWPDAYYLTTNESSPANYALDRIAMLAGNPATSQRFTAPDLSGFGFQTLTPGDLDGSTLPPAGSPGYFMRHVDTEAHGPGGFPTEDFLEVWAFDVDFVTPANSTFTQVANISVAEFDSELCGFFAFACFPQPGTTTTLDPLREVVMWRLVYRNFGAHEVLLGNLVTDVDGTDHGGVRWFELRKVGANPWSLYQEGTYAPDQHSRWMAAIAMDGEGNIAMGYNVSSGTFFPSLRYAGRLAGDPLGTMPQGEGVLIDGSGSNASNRYGDYSAMSIDPADDCTFWFTGEYNASSQWSTRIGTFKFDACGQADFTLSGTPASQAVCTPNDAVYQIDVGQVQNFTDPVTLSAQGNPAGTTTNFTVNPVVPPGSSDLTVGNMGAAAFGSYAIDVVGIAPTSTHTTTVTLDVYTAVPGAPALVSPANGATGVNKTPTFTWSAASQGAGYELEVATDAGFGTLVYTATVGGTTHMAGTALAPLTTHYWRVKAANECGEGAWSGTYSFTTEDIPPILLVEDEGAGSSQLSVYTGALDSLGYSYDVWDTTGSDVEPGAADMAPYEAIIWWTGALFGSAGAGPAGPSGSTETALGAWLDGGGCLFISSQDYRYDKGLTGFMTGYLGVTNVTNDNGDYTSVTGQNEFAGQGPYSLSYPFTDYSDPLTVGNGGQAAMRGNNDRVGGVTKETVDYKTSYWAFPWEALPAGGQLATMQTLLDWCEVGLEPSFFEYLPLVVREP